MFRRAFQPAVFVQCRGASKVSKRKGVTLKKPSASKRLQPPAGHPSESQPNPSSIQPQLAQTASSEYTVTLAAIPDVQTRTPPTPEADLAQFVSESVAAGRQALPHFDDFYADAVDVEDRQAAAEKEAEPPPPADDAAAAEEWVRQQQSMAELAREYRSENPGFAAAEKLARKLAKLSTQRKKDAKKKKKKPAIATASEPPVRDPAARASEAPAAGASASVDNHQPAQATSGADVEGSEDSDGVPEGKAARRGLSRKKRRNAKAFTTSEMPQAVATGRQLKQMSRVPQVEVPITTLKPEPVAAPEPLLRDALKTRASRKQSKSSGSSDLAAMLEQIERATDAEVQRSTGEALPPRSEMPQGVDAPTILGAEGDDGDDVNMPASGARPVKKGEIKLIQRLPAPTTSYLKGVPGYQFRDGKEDIFVYGSPQLKIDALQPFLSMQEAFKNILKSRRKAWDDPLALLVDHADEHSYQDLTTVQRWALPLLFSGCHLVCQAGTGSGKTLAFLIPMLNHMFAAGHSSNKFMSHPTVLVICGSRIAAMQINTKIRALSRKNAYVKLFCHGAEGMDTRENMIRLGEKGCDVVVCTPASFKRFLQNVPRDQRFHLADVRYVVVDEADTIRRQADGILKEMKLDKAAEDSVARYRKTPVAQFCLWSATWEDTSIIKKLPDHGVPLESLVSLKIGKTPLNPDIAHKLTTTSYSEEYSNVERLWRSGELHPAQKIIIFANSPEKVHGITERLTDYAKTLADDAHANFPVFGIWAAMDPEKFSQRQKAFAKSPRGVLITTAVALRGMDVSVDRVVVMEPIDEGGWLHAVGRCVRAGRKGKAITFINPASVPVLPGLLTLLQDTFPDDPVWNRSEVIESSARSAYASTADEFSDELTGISEKHLDISPEVFELADRVSFAVRKLGRNRRAWQGAVGTIKRDSHTDQFDPTVTYKAKMDEHLLHKRKDRLRRQVERTTWGRALRHLTRKSATVSFTKRYGTLQSEAVLQARMAHHEKNKDEFEQYKMLQTSAKQDYRNKQVNLWRKRTGIADYDSLPEHVATMPTDSTFVPKTQEHIINSSKGPLRVSSEQTRDGIKKTRFLNVTAPV
ncbi:DEAD-box ATP-dependent RNA helicase 42 [Diplonema papillatum]|nr:DEAD-box ATP-dependent RNA helicase 42 [Diplonema papillatum]